MEQCHICDEETVHGQCECTRQQYVIDNPDECFAEPRAVSAADIIEELGSFCEDNFDGDDAVIDWINALARKARAVK